MHPNRRATGDGRDDVFHRYCLPGGRYRKLIGGNFMWNMGREDRASFGRAMALDSRTITDDEVRRLLGGDWRERLTGAWLTGFDRRREFQETISKLLLERREPYAGKGYCFALARFGTERDAATLRSYLKKYLADLDLRSDQPWAMGALLVLDERLGSDRAGEFLNEDGLWERWARAGRPPIFEAAAMKAVLEGWCLFAEESLRSIVDD
ncbi:DUF6000 family protein [Thermostaphylospora chromogena]|nr:DUF6000 family protein [Thermostaphylospora chromogena]